MRIHDWPASERPRERLMSRGAQSLSDAELLALFIGQGLPGVNAVDLARLWLKECNSLAQLLSQERQDFKRLPGAGDARFVILQAALELGKRAIGQPLMLGEALTNPRAVQQFLERELARQPREHFGCLYLDSQHRALHWEVLFSGTLNAAAVYPREVVRSSLARGAAAVILAHNHPSGVAEPSQADRQITERLVDALQLVDIKVLDHLVIGAGSNVSFAERGWL